ncbi:MAG TPA: hypothetical protein VGM98_03115, partial [Schlesneria sp.]
MTTKKKSIAMFDHERRFLEEAYVRRRIPLDQYEERPTELHALCEEWRSQFGRTEKDEDIFHYMRTRRKNGSKKCGNWPKLGTNHEPAPTLPDLTAEQKEVLVEIYYEHVADLGNGSDNIAYEPEVMAMIATEFLHRTGRGEIGSMLVGILTAMRKRGLLPKVR